MSYLIALDPGRSKCGLVLADLEMKVVLQGKVINAEDVIDLVIAMKKQFSLDLILLGNGTSSDYWNELLRDILLIKVVEERGTTLLARKRYYELWPPSKFISWLPKGLFIPPHDLDAVAALLLLEDFLEEKLDWPGPPIFRTSP